MWCGSFPTPRAVCGSSARLPSRRMRTGWLQPVTSTPQCASAHAGRRRLRLCRRAFQHLKILPAGAARSRCARSAGFLCQGAASPPRLLRHNRFSSPIWRHTPIVCTSPLCPMMSRERRAPASRKRQQRPTYEWRQRRLVGLLARTIRLLLFGKFR